MDAASAKRCRSGGARAENPRRALSVFAEEIANAGIDRFAPTPTAEDSVVPDAGHHVVLTASGGDAGTQAVGGLGLAIT